MVVGGSTPLPVAARALLGERLDDFGRRVGDLLESPGREEVHDLRVSSRRLREALLLFAPCCPCGATDAVAAGVKRVTGALGKVRVADEAAVFFAEAAANLRGDAGRHAERLSASVRRSRKRRVVRLGRMICRLAPAAFLERYREAIAAPLPMARVPLSSFAWRSFLHLASRMACLLPLAVREEEVAAQHRLRIVFKHFRYRLELVGFLLPESFHGFHRHLKRYQDILGEMHDLDDFAALAQKERLPPRVSAEMLALMADRRRTLFVDFREMLEDVPPVALGERVIRLLR